MPTRLLRPLLLLSCLRTVFPSSAHAGVAQLQGVNTSSIPRLIDQALDGPFLVVGQDPNVNEAWRAQEERGFAALSALAANEKACHLRTLMLGVPVSTRSIAFLGSQCFAGLEHLEISHGLDDETAQTLAGLPLVGNLRTMKIFGGLTGQEGLAALLASAGRLERLNFWAADRAALPEVVRTVASYGAPTLRGLALYSSESTKAPLPAKILEPLARLPAVEDVRVGSLTIDLSDARALLACGLAQRLHRLYGHIDDLQTAIELGTGAPRLEIPDASSSVRGALSSAAARTLMRDGIVPASVTLYSDDDVRRLEGVIEVRGSLQLAGPLHDLAPLRRLRHIDGSLNIISTGVTDLAGLASLRSVNDDVGIGGNLQLRTAELPSLAEVGGDVWLPTCENGNPRLATMSFPALVRVGGRLEVSDQPGAYDTSTDWRSEGCGDAVVTKVRVQPFPRLVFIGKANEFVEAHTALFPVLERSDVPTGQ